MNNPQDTTQVTDEQIITIFLLVLQVYLLCVGYVLWPSHSPECCVVFSECTVNTVHGLSQVTDEQIITIFHLVLQVHCSPSLKEHLHNPVMTFHACSIERTDSILCAHGGVCGVVCVNVHAYLCVAWAGVWCVYMCISVCIHACISAFQMVDTNLQVYYQ